MESKLRETYLFPVNVKKLVEGEKNKVIKIFLNQLDLKLNAVGDSFPDTKEDIDKIKRELRQVFLDSMNGFSRFSKGLLKHYTIHGDFVERLTDKLLAIKTEESEPEKIIEEVKNAKKR